ncbi:MAG TPA: hypothetical protein ENJ60_03430 [Aeromonadales bacterium]|nr:hypothetical protein [Aeromonadales bacterium]
MNFKNKKIATKIRNSLLVLLIAVLSFGLWLPNYLVLEKGININITSDRLYNCLTHPENWQQWGAKWKTQPVEFKVGDQLEFTQLVKASPLVIEELVEGEYINFQGEIISLALLLENEGTQTWLSISIEEKLGNNPLKKLMRHFFHSGTTQQLNFNLKLIAQTCV